MAFLTTESALSERRSTSRFARKSPVPCRLGRSASTCPERARNTYPESVPKTCPQSTCRGVAAEGNPEVLKRSLVRSMRSRLAPLGRMPA
jgi:hypothetical protein